MVAFRAFKTLIASSNYSKLHKTYEPVLQKFLLVNGEVHGLAFVVSQASLHGTKEIRRRKFRADIKVIFMCISISCYVLLRT